MTIKSTKRAADFSFTGNYVVTFNDGSTTLIYRDVDFGFSRWLEDRATALHDDNFLGWTKGEALAKLVANRAKP